MRSCCFHPSLLRCLRAIDLSCFVYATRFWHPTSPSACANQVLASFLFLSSIILHAKMMPIPAHTQGSVWRRCQARNRPHPTMALLALSCAMPAVRCPIACRRRVRSGAPTPGVPRLRAWRPLRAVNPEPSEQPETPPRGPLGEDEMVRRNACAWCLQQGQTEKWPQHQIETQHSRTCTSHALDQCTPTARVPPQFSVLGWYGCAL